MNTALDSGGGVVPPRTDWPEPVPHTEAGAALTEVILTTFRLNARLMEAAQELGANGGLTASWWQVLGGVLDQPRSVAGIARRMGMTRQGVQRVADLLVAREVDVVHLLGPGATLEQRPFAEAEVRNGRLYLCGTLVA